MDRKIWLIGCEESQAVTAALRHRGIEAYSCDLKPCSGGHPEWHFQGDIFSVTKGGHLITQSGEEVFIPIWYAGIFFPDCTYLTCSAEWAYKDAPYHQKVKPETLVGEARREARQAAMSFFLGLWNLDQPDALNGKPYGIQKIAMENPIGFINKFMKPTQIIHPYMFGDDASKSTCLWLKGFPKLEIKPEKYFEPRIVDGKKRWGNQTDTGQNRLSPDKDRAEKRSKTYAGIAEAMAEQWGSR